MVGSIPMRRLVASNSSKLCSSSMVIVDCGSGYSRVSNFYRSETNLIHATKSGTYIPALHTIMHCPEKSTEWLQQLIDIVKEVDSEATQVLLGATGGVRDLISSGEITAKEVERFQELLATTPELPFKVHFLILSGDDEAKYEFVSAEYCANQCGFADAQEQETTKTASYGNLGLLSSGGMSSQIFVKGKSLCLPTEVKKGNKMGLKHGMEKGKATFHEHAKEAIELKLPKNFGGENVLYLAIESLAGVGEKAGMGGGVAVPVVEAIEILSTFIEKKTEEDLMLGEGAGERTWRSYFPVMTGIVGRLILERLHPDSKVLFAREFEIAEDHILKPSWPLGHAIEKLIHETVPCTVR
mmetsp:Transcript_36451/g.76519  ORF Transcript_36451/g.76519 Transcript_36451/m.76519 type:complete len:355 (+) Transcript_36451:93-1157(+)